jgi:hypothetical protein
MEQCTIVLFLFQKSFIKERSIKDIKREKHGHYSLLLLSLFSVYFKKMRKKINQTIEKTLMRKKWVKRD